GYYLDGPGTLHVTHLLDWTAGTMQGSGTTVIDEGASASVHPLNFVDLDTRKLQVAGALSFDSGFLYPEFGAVVETTQTGTITVNGGYPTAATVADGLIRNYGTLQKTNTASSAVVQMPVENEGLVDVSAGEF